MSIEKPREIAVRALRRHESSSHYIEDVLDEELARSPLATLDRALVQELTYGVVRWKATLDWLIGRKTGGRSQKPALRILLRLGLYQIFWLDRIPDHAAVNESVEMAKRLGFGPQSGFINAVLRGYIREQVETKRVLEELKMRQPYLGFSQPEWLCARWESRWGSQNTAQLLEWNNRPPQVFARVNALQTDAGKLVTQWQAEGVLCEAVVREWTGENLVFELKSFPPLASLPSFKQGLFYVQDPSTLLAVRELDPQPGESVLDLCAAPGGKTTFMARIMQNQGRIVAADVDADRLALISENCRRLGVTCVEARHHSTLASQLPGLFDRVLIDAPCSNTGVMRRRIDLRWRIRPEEIERLRTLQCKLLEKAAAHIKHGGTIVYSTCSLEPEENSQVVQEFLAKNPTFRLAAERELLPFRDGVDGAYVARLISANP